MEIQDLIQRMDGRTTNEELILFLTDKYKIDTSATSFASDLDNIYIGLNQQLLDLAKVWIAHLDGSFKVSAQTEIKEVLERFQYELVQPNSDRLQSNYKLLMSLTIKCKLFRLRYVLEKTLRFLSGLDGTEALYYRMLGDILEKYPYQPIAEFKYKPYVHSLNLFSEIIFYSVSKVNFNQSLIEAFEYFKNYESQKLNLCYFIEAYRAHQASNKLAITDFASSESDARNAILLKCDQLYLKNSKRMLESLHSVLYASISVLEQQDRNKIELQARPSYANALQVTTKRQSVETARLKLAFDKANRATEMTSLQRVAFFTFTSTRCRIPLMPINPSIPINSAMRFGCSSVTRRSLAATPCTGDETWSSRPIAPATVINRSHTSRNTRSAL